MILKQIGEDKMINIELAEALDLDEDTIENIQILQDLRDEMEEDVKEETDEELIRATYVSWLQVHRHLQKLWGFPQDDNYIKFWTFPRCSCPKIDYEDNYPTGYYTTNYSCLVHKKVDKCVTKG